MTKLRVSVNSATKREYISRVIDQHPLDWVLDMFKLNLENTSFDNRDKDGDFKAFGREVFLMNSLKITKEQYDKAYKASDGYQGYGTLEIMDLGKLY